MRYSGNAGCPAKHSFAANRRAKAQKNIVDNTKIGVSSTRFGKLAAGLSASHVERAPKEKVTGTAMSFFTPILFLLLVASSTIAQIECAPVNYRRAFAKANNVFLGEAVKYMDNPSLKQGNLTVRFKVNKSWKGAKQDSEIIVRTFIWTTDWHVQIGNKYLVYTYGKEMSMPTGCSASKPYATDSTYDLTDQNAQIKQLNSWWFRFRARNF